MDLSSFSHKLPGSNEISQEQTWAEVQAQEWEEIREQERRFSLPEGHPEHPFYEDYCEKQRLKREAAVEKDWELCLDASKRIQQVEDPIKQKYILLQEWRRLKHRLHKADFRELYSDWLKAQEVAA